MEIVRRQFLRNIKLGSNNIFIKSIMTSAARCDKVVEELEKNPYFEKYADKIAKLQQTSPQELVSRFEEQKTKSKSTPSKDR